VKPEIYNFKTKLDPNIIVRARCKLIGVRVKFNLVCSFVNIWN
jgi:hypothetical protein